jgi:hypothetical protein
MQEVVREPPGERGKSCPITKFFFAVCHFFRFFILLNE